MAKEKPKFLLFKLESGLERLEEVILSEKGIKERRIQNLFKENLSKVFDLIFLKEEHFLINPDTGKKDCRVDTLAFSKKNRCFVIIEYKRGESLELYEQANEYINCLKGDYEECIHNCYELLDILKDKVKTKWSYNDIYWKETKGICIATEIDKRLRHHQRPSKQKDENIKIIEVKFFDNQKILYINTSNLPEWLTITKNTENNNKTLENKDKENNNTKRLWNIDDIVDWVKPEIKDLLLKIVNISFLKNLVSNIKGKFFRENHLYRFDIDYREKNQKKILYSVAVWKGQINFWFNFGRRQEIAEMTVFLDSYKLGNKPKSTYWSLKRIKNENDFQKLKNFFQEYRDNFSKNNKI